MRSPLFHPRSLLAGEELPPQAAKSTVVPTFSARQYWEDRHGTLRGQLKAVGHVCLTEEANAQQYTVKVERLSHVLQDHVGPRRGATLLDAGCGIGALIPFYRELGFEVTGVDISPTAISEARARGIDALLLVARLDELRLGRRFDAVLAVDVLQHVTEDAEWLRTLASLERHLSSDGRLVILDCMSDFANSAQHCRRRAQETYVAALESLDLLIIEHQQFRLEHEDSTKDLLVARRGSPIE